jgi:hypothetical protein
MKTLWFWLIVILVAVGLSWASRKLSPRSRLIVMLSLLAVALVGFSFSIYLLLQEE